MAKKLIFALLFLLPVGTAWADDFPYIAFESVSGEVQTLAVEGLKISFTDGQLVATSNAGTRTLPLATLAKMYFTPSPTGITEESLGQQDNGSADVFDLQGRRIGSDLRQAPRGVYVVKRNGKTEKVAVR